METELFYLTLVTVFTGILWVPYILDRLMVRGIVYAVGYPADPKPQSPWARTLAFVVAFLAQALLAWEILATTSV